MENENSTVNQEISIKQGKNIFRLDGPIGRKRYITTLFILVGIYLIFLGIAYLLRITIGYNDVKVLHTILSVIFSLIYFYIIFINTSKRVYDIICQKDKACYYSIVYMVACFAMQYIPALNIIAGLLYLLVNLTLIFKKGKLV